jgi:hypothetical protein
MVFLLPVLCLLSRNSALDISQTGYKIHYSYGAAKAPVVAHGCEAE